MIIIIPAATKNRQRENELASCGAFALALSWPNELFFFLLATARPYNTPKLPGWLVQFIIVYLGLLREK